MFSDVAIKLFIGIEYHFFFQDIAICFVNKEKPLAGVYFDRISDSTFPDISRVKLRTAIQDDTIITIKRFSLVIPCNT